MTQQPKKMTTKDYERLGKTLEEVYLIGYANPRRFLWFSFLRGVVYGLGLFIGGTIVVAFVLWTLTKFNHVPVVGPFIDKIIDIIKTSPASTL